MDNQYCMNKTMGKLCREFLCPQMNICSGYRMSHLQYTGSYGVPSYGVNDYTIEGPAPLYRPSIINPYQIY